jgi:hypothetical protein
MYLEQEEIFLKLVEVTKIKVSEMEERDGKKPTFEDYVDEMIEEDVISMNNLESQMRAHALAWSGAKLGKSDWRNLFNEINNNIVNANSVLTTSKDTVKEKKIEEKKHKNIAFEKKLYLVDKFIVYLFGRIDNEFVRLIKNLGFLSISILVITFYVTRSLLFEYGGHFIYSHFESEKYTLYSMLIVATSLFVFATNDEMKIDILRFIRNFIIPKLIVFLLVIGLIFTFSNLYNWGVELFS